MHARHWDICRACRRPMAQMSSAEIAAEKSTLEAREDLNIVICWASAKLFDSGFDLPAGRIGQWLRALTVEDAGLIAAANGAGALADQLAGKRLSPIWRRSTVSNRHGGGSSIADPL